MPNVILNWYSSLIRDLQLEMDKTTRQLGKELSDAKNSLALAEKTNASLTKRNTYVLADNHGGYCTLFVAY